jgi:uncharacterized membrane protein YidH (DUF202 family)
MPKARNVVAAAPTFRAGRRRSLALIGTGIVVFIAIQVIIHSVRIIFFT